MNEIIASSTFLSETALILSSTGESSKPSNEDREASESRDEPINNQLSQLAADKEWDAKNWKVIIIISLLLSVLNKHTVQNYQYARDI